MSRSWAVSSAG